MLERIKGARIIRNQENLGFGPAFMHAVDAAAFEYLWFFNSDALLTDNGIEAALGNFVDTPGVGAVGGKILLADGRLQEAGLIIWSDGSAVGYGRDEPQKPQYTFRGSVDYCSAVFLI